MDVPEVAVDRHEFVWYRLSMSEHWCYIHKVVARYYKDTSWKEFCKTDGQTSQMNDHGAPLVDQWMLFEDGHSVGRVIGWAQIGDYFTRCHGVRDTFSTREEAVAEAIKRANKIIEVAKKTIKKQEKLIKGFGGLPEAG